MDSISAVVKAVHSLAERCQLVRCNRQEASSLQQRLLRLEVCLDSIPSNTLIAQILQDALNASVQRGLAVVTACQTKSFVKSAFYAGGWQKELRVVHDELGRILQELQVRAYVLALEGTLSVLTYVLMLFVAACSWSLRRKAEQRSLCD